MSNYKFTEYLVNYTDLPYDYYDVFPEESLFCIEIEELQEKLIIIIISPNFLIKKYPLEYNLTEDELIERVRELFNEQNDNDSILTKKNIKLTVRHHYQDEIVFDADSYIKWIENNQKKKGLKMNERRKTRNC